MGGVGKSTVALAAAKMALDKGWRVCWINSVTTATLTGGVVEMLDQLNAPVSVIEAVRSGAASAAERTWNFLNSSNAARRALRSSTAQTTWLSLLRSARRIRLPARDGCDRSAAGCWFWSLPVIRTGKPGARR